MSINEWTQQVHKGDAVETLWEMPESSVHMVMTSPPYYGLRDYGVDGQLGLEESLDEYIENMVEVGQALRRVLRPDGVWWLNLGDTYSGGGGVGGKPADWDDLHNDDVFPEEPVGRSTPLGRKNKMLVPARVAIGLQDDGWVVRQDTVWDKPNPLPEAVKDRFAETKEYVFHLTPEPDYWFDLDSVREPHKEASLERAKRPYEGAKTWDHTPYPDRDSESQLHCFDTPLHPSGKNPGDVFTVPVKAFPEAHFAVYPEELVETYLKPGCPPIVCAECAAPHGRVVEEGNRRVAGGSPAVDLEGTGYKDRTGNHQGRREGFTLPEPEFKGWEQACDCDTDATEPGIVLDPFAGAGTTCLVAKRLGRRFIGIDLNPEYVAMAQKRVGIDVDEPELLLEDGETPITAYTDGGGSP